MRIENGLLDLLTQCTALRLVEPAVNPFAALQELPQAFVVQLGAGELEPILAEIGVVLLVFALQVQQLIGSQAHGQRHDGGLGPFERGMQPLAQLGDEGAGLGSADVAGHQFFQVAQHRLQAGQLLGAVPQVQAGEFFANRRGLLLGEVDVAVQPPVSHLTQAVVPQLDGAATRQRRGNGQQTDNPDNC